LRFCIIIYVGGGGSGGGGGIKSCKGRIEGIVKIDNILNVLKKLALDGRFFLRWWRLSPWRGFTFNKEINWF